MFVRIQRIFPIMVLRRTGRKETASHGIDPADGCLHNARNKMNWVRSERKRRNVSQAKLAKLLNLKQAILSQWELGKGEPSEHQRMEISRALSELDEQLTSGDRSLFRKRRFKRAVGAKPLRKQPSTVLVWRKAEPEGDKGHPHPKAIALFAGCGGMSLGLRSAGLDVVGYVELNGAARKIYDLNFPRTECLGTEIRHITESDILGWKRFGEIAVLVGGPPCQGFSLAGKRDSHDPRNELFRYFAEIARLLKPASVILENVRLMTSMRDKTGVPMPDPISVAFDEAGYRVRFKPLNARDFGIPQFRERVVFIGIRKDLAVEPSFPAPTHGVAHDGTLFSDSVRPYVTFRGATEDLERLESGQASFDDPLHFAVTHPEHVIRMLRQVPEGKSAHENEDPQLRPSSGYNTTYKRLKWDEPCSTIGTNFSMISGCRNVHPEQTRSLTIREALRCQTFPDTFAFRGTFGEIRTVIGNAVPPKLAEVIGAHVLSLLAGSVAVIPAEAACKSTQLQG
jgi:DNA (cytosine-5)-methyltransferase 1